MEDANWEITINYETSEVQRLIRHATQSVLLPKSQ